MKRILFLLVFALGITSCSSTQQFAKFVSSDTPPMDGMAKINVVRKKSMYASAIKSKIYQDKELIGKLGNGSYLSWESKAAPINLIAATENRDSIKIDLEPNKQYYFSLEYKTGFLMARADLNLIDKTEFDQLMGKTKKPKVKSL